MMRQIPVFAVILALFVCFVSTAPYHKNEKEKDKPVETITELRQEISSKLDSFAIMGKQKRETVTKNDPANVNRDNEAASEELLEKMSEEFKGNPCATEPCKNDGKCKWRKDQTPRFVCICKTGYLGKVCDKEVTCGFSISWDIVHILCGIAGAVMLVCVCVSIHTCRINNRRNKTKKQFEDCLKTGQLPTSYPPGILATSNELCCMFWCCGRGDQSEIKQADFRMKKQADVKVPGKKSRSGRSEKGPLIKHSSNRQRSSCESIPFDNLQRCEATVHHSQRTVSSTISDCQPYQKKSSHASVILENLRSCMATVKSKGNKSPKKVSFKDLDDLPHQKKVHTQAFHCGRPSVKGA